jgi:hypothetical protein
MLALAGLRMRQYKLTSKVTTHNSRQLNITIALCSSLFLAEARSLNKITLAPLVIQAAIPGALATYVRNETESDNLRIESWGICVYPQNSCSSDARCRLNDTVIAAATKPVPGWVEPGLRNLFNKTISEHGKAYVPWEKPISEAAVM